ncbi:maltase-glucoamylase-like [Lineus longissimus]|uniref:maltase-glucoamylase-like n=1 Tax=Lineus longissimus TaxID=88925 RepID=UPI00315CA7DC
MAGECDKKQLLIFVGILAVIAVIMVPTIILTSRPRTDDVTSPPTTDEPPATEAEMLRVNCLPDVAGLSGEVSKEVCDNRGCIFAPSANSKVAACYVPSADHGYRMIGETKPTSLGFEVELSMKRKGLFGGDIDNVTLAVEMRSNDMLRFKFYDPASSRYEVPIELHLGGIKARTPRYEFKITNQDPFAFQVIRRSSGTVLWDTSVGGFMFADQFLQIATKLPSRNIYGFGENLHHSFRHDLNFRTWPMFARDQPPSFWGENLNLYGVHPFYTNIENDGQSHGVFLLNSNAMDYSLTNAPMLTYRTIGGILDFFVFLGPSPENVIQQYTKLIGRPYMPPYWSLGFQLCRYGYNKLANLKDAVDRTKQFNIPHDVQYADIDHMDTRMDFTVDSVNFAGLADYFDELRSGGMKTIIILDPCIITNVSNYRPYDLGKEMDVFIKWPSKEATPPADYADINATYMLGFVWPQGKVVFPDYLKENTSIYWKELIVEHRKNLSFDGLWIDMNEPANFGTNGERPFNWPVDAKPYWALKCPESKWDDPPYRTWAASIHDQSKDILGRLSDKTLCMVGTHGDGKYKHYDVHNLYGWSQSKPTLDALRAANPGKRGMVISRSTYPSSGTSAGHWLGDNVSQWRDLHESIVGMLEFNLFGIPYVGSDICGFWGESNAELCKRWMQLGAFYPFSRNHNGELNTPQDPGYYGGDVAELSRDSLETRYRLLPYLYTLFHIAHTRGNTVVRALHHEFPADTAALGVDRQFLWGEGLLISPILEMGQSKLEFYLPGKQGWYDYYTGKVLTTKENEMLVEPKTRIPLHIRGGYILPTQEPANNTYFSRQNSFGLIVAPSVQDGRSSGELFWDDGDSVDTYENGRYYMARFMGEKSRISMTIEYNSGVPEIEQRILDSIRIFHVDYNSPWVYINGNISHNSYSYDKANKVLTLDNLNLKMTEDFTIEWSSRRLPTTEEAHRLNCFPEWLEHSSLTEAKCLNRGCVWQPVPENDNVPACYLNKTTFGYTMVSEVATPLGKRFNLRWLSSSSMFGGDIHNVTLDVEMVDTQKFRIKLYDPNNARYEVPVPLNWGTTKAGVVDFEILGGNYANGVFGLKISRKSTGQMIWDTTVGGLAFADQFLQLATKLPSEDIYGIGENRHDSFKHDINYQAWPLFSRDQPPESNHKNLYGVHPFYMNVEDAAGHANGVLLLNSNAMEISLQPGPILTYRTTGGVLDFYIVLGDSPEQVVQQYTEIIGRPYLPPYWSLGFQLCRYGYNSLENLKAAVKRTMDAGIPLDVQYADIDHMDERKDFTWDAKKFAGLPQYVKELQSAGIRFITILDPALLAEDSNYHPYVLGKAMDVFIKWPNGTSPDFEYFKDHNMLGYVWPAGKVVFPDYLKPATHDYWQTLIVDHHSNISFDGLWIDMNEPANFGTNEDKPFNLPEGDPEWSLKCATTSLDDPPYVPATFKGKRLSDKTLCMVGLQNDSMYHHYDVHSLYGWSQTEPTLNALQQATGERGIVISRSTYPSSGAKSGHWLGDNVSSWRSMRDSIIGMLEFNLFGIPYIGADICGFFDNATSELCQRWMQIGAFYPFSRNHNGINYKDQDPAAFGQSVAASSKKALEIRYELLPYLYTLFYQANTEGRTVVRSLMNEFPTDLNCRSIDRQFMWGSGLMIAPVLEEGKTSVDAYLPGARWFDYYSGAEVTGCPRVFTAAAPLDTIPLVIQGGNILPTQKPANNTHYSRLNPFGLIIAPDENGLAAGTLFWDDGVGKDTVKANKYFLANFTYAQVMRTIEVKNLSDTGPDMSSMTLNSLRVFGVITKPKELLLAGNPIKVAYSYDAESKELLVEELGLRMNTDNFVLSWQ